MPAPPTTVRTTKATRTIVTSTPKYSARPAATPVSMRSWMGLQRAVRSGSAWYLGSVWEWGSKMSVVGASGFTVVVLMALAWLREPGQHIGKIPSAPLIPGDRHQGRIRDGLGQGLARAGIHPLRGAPHRLIRTPCGDGARPAERRKYSAGAASTPESSAIQVTLSARLRPVASWLRGTGQGWVEYSPDTTPEPA